MSISVKISDIRRGTNNIIIGCQVEQGHWILVGNNQYAIPNNNISQLVSLTVRKSKILQNVTCYIVEAMQIYCHIPHQVGLQGNSEMSCTGAFF